MLRAIIIEKTIRLPESSSCPTTFDTNWALEYSILEFSIRNDSNHNVVHSDPLVSFLVNRTIYRTVLRTDVLYFTLYILYHRRN